MTDTEFAKEVAEKVWGWKKVKNPNELSVGSNHELLYLDGDEEYHLTTHPEDHVNSWQGFGRTVEAMAPEYSLRINEIVVFFQHIDNPDGIWSQSMKGSFAVGYEATESSYPKNIIKATHQAALDAVKEEG